MERKEGYYWIKIKTKNSPAWEVAEFYLPTSSYKMPHWYVFGWEYPIYEEDIETVVEIPLLNPDEQNKQCQTK